MANKDKENKIKKFTKEAIGKTLNQFNKEIGIADLVEINKNQDRILNGILSQVNDESTEKTEKSNIITLDNSTDGIVELKEIQGDTNVNVSKIEEDMPITHDIGDKEGNIFSLNEITQGAISIGEIQGNTMVNCNKDDKKELVLMKDLSTEGYSNVTLTEGVDGGLVDVALEGNTLVNVCDQKDPVAITKSYTVETGNHVTLQGEYDGKCRPVVTGNTLWIDNDTEDVLTAFDGTKNLRLQSSFEDRVVTQEMVDVGEELAENLGKYKVDYVVTGKNKFDGKLEQGNIDGSTGYPTDSTARIRTSNYIKVKPNTTYGISRINTGGNLGLRLYDNNLNYIGNAIGLSYKQLNSTFTTTNNNYYIKFIDETNILSNLYQIEEGAEATSYEPYKEYKKTFYLNSPLLEGDTIEQSGNNVVHVHRYRKVVLDGSENWIIGNEDFKENCYYFKLTKVAQSNEFAYSSFDGNICSNYICFPNGRNDSPGICINKGNGINTIEVIDLKTNFTSYDTALNEFKNKLQSNPITVTYKLATPTYEVISQSDTILCDSYVNGHLDVDSIVPIEKVVFKETPNFNLNYLYPNTEYTIQFESDNNGKLDRIGFWGAILYDKNIVKGINKFNFSTKDDIRNYIYMWGIGFNVSNIVVTEATDQDFGYFEGMKSVGEYEDLEVVSCNKNLLPLNHEFEVGSINSEGYPVNNTVRKRSKDFIKVNSTNDITLLAQGAGWVSIVAYDRNKECIKLVQCDSTKVSLHSDKLIYYVKILTDSLSTITNIQLEEGSVSTDYIPHQSTTQILTHEPLRSVGDTKDKYVLIDGKWYIERNTAEVVLDGSDDEVWVIDSSYHVFKYNISNVYYKGNFGEGICDKYLQVKGTIGNTLGKFKIQNNMIMFSNNSINSISDWKTYLQSNPITVVYKLSTPQYEPIDYNPFAVYSNTTHISNNSTIPCNMTIKNTGYNCLLKPSTTYTVSSNLGLNTVTTPSTLTEDCLRFYDTDTSDVTTMKDVMVLEGDWTSKADLIPSNFSGIESCFEQELVTDENDVNYGKYKVTAKVVGKNLFKGYDDISEIKGGKVYILNSGTISTPTRFKFRVYDGNMKQITELSSRTYGVYYNESRKYFITGSDSSKLNNNKLDMPNNAKYLQPIENDQRYIDIQLEQGTEATAYEPYKESDVTFYIDEPLRGIGDIKDKVYVKNDKVVVERNCGSVTLDDGENWSYGGNYYYTKINNVNLNAIIPLCDKFVGILLPDGVTYPYVQYGGILGSRNGNIIFGNTGKTYIEFKQWLQQNPTTVVYQLAEPTYEEVDYQEQRLFLNTYNNSTLFYESNIPVSNTSFKPLWEELVYVKSNTKYYIQFNAVGSGEVVINLGGTELTTEIVEGYNCIPITTPSESTNLMTIIGQGITISEVVVSEVICGGYYKGLQSCFEEHMENGKYRILLRGIALDGSKVNGIKLYINEPLRGIEDIKDRLCIKNGKLMVERRCTELIINDTNPYYISSNNDKYPSVLRIFYNKNSIQNYNDGYCLCDTLPSYGFINKDVIGIGRGNGLDIHLPLPTTSTIDEAREYLKNNPLKIVYQLAEPTYEEVTNEYGLPIVFEGYENGIVYIDSAVTPATHIKYTSNNQLATTLSEAEEQNIATQEDINMNVITYMMDIDMILTDMEMSSDISVMAVRRDSSNENMLDRMSEEDKKVYRDNTVVMLEKMITANVLEKEDIERRINMYYDKNRISKEQYEYLKSLL